MKSYINVYNATRDKLVHEYIEDGIYKREVVQYQPLLGYITPKESIYKDIYGNNLETRRFQSMTEASEWKKENGNLFDIYNDIDYTSAFIAENYSTDIQIQKKSMSIYAIDIEVYSSTGGFPKSNIDDDIITCICFLNMVTRKSYVYGLKDFTVTTDNIQYTKCKNEEHLLECIIDVFNRQNIQIISGWYLDFDVNYILERIEKILGEEESKRLSPVRKIYKSKKKVNNNQVESYDIVGITNWDYLLLFKKFTYDNRPSYTLDNICIDELGESKLEYKKQHESLNALYDNDYQTYITYNIRDCELILLLDDKLKFIDVGLSYAYMQKCTLDSILGTTKSWDSSLMNILYNKNILVPPLKNSVAVDYSGGFVKDMVKGLHKWLSVYDLVSSYPNTICTYNISPDTIVDRRSIPKELHEELMKLKDIEDYIDIDDERFVCITKQLKELNLSLCANGTIYSNDKMGFIPEIIKKIFDGRKEVKGIISSKKKLISETNDKEVISKLKDEIDKLEIISTTYKIQMNSLYGALANQFFRWNDVRLASAITCSAQVSNRGLINYIERYIKNLPVVYGDTDSNFLSLQNIVDARYGDNVPDDKTVLEFILKYQDKVVTPVMNSFFKKLAIVYNTRMMTISAEHETIADKSLMVEKKMYVMRQVFKDGYSLLDKPKYKIKGLAVIKTAAYPVFTRQAMRKVIELIIEKEDNKLVIKEIQDFKKEFYKALPDQITSPISVNMVGNQTDKATGKVIQVPHTLQSKGLPKQVRAAFVYNKAIKQLRIDKKYESIKDGNKIRYIAIKQPNIFQSPVIGCIEKLPPEILEHVTIDYDEQWEKTFKKPVLAILDSIGYQFDKILDLGGFFD